MDIIAEANFPGTVDRGPLLAQRRHRGWARVIFLTAVEQVARRICRAPQENSSRRLFMYMIFASEGVNYKEWF
jgi:hypothetical protein